MKNMGVLNPYWNPVKAAGLTQTDIDYLAKAGWKHHTVEDDVPDAPVGFAAPEMPGGYTMHNVSIPKGTEVMYDPDTERAVILACGNPTCWRYLVK